MSAVGEQISKEEWTKISDGGGMDATRARQGGQQQRKLEIEDASREEQDSEEKELALCTRG